MPLNAAVENRSNPNGKIILYAFLERNNVTSERIRTVLESTNRRIRTLFILIRPLCQRTIRRKFNFSSLPNNYARSAFRKSPMKSFLPSPSTEGLCVTDLLAFGEPLVDCSSLFSYADSFF